MSRKLGSCLFGLALLALPATHVEAQSTRPVRVNIESTPVGAAVFVDSQTSATLGRTPLRNVPVPRGQHRLIFVLDNHETVEMAVNVARCARDVRATLQPLSRLVITAGNDSPTAPRSSSTVQRGGLPFDQMLQPGRHQLRVTRRGLQHLRAVDRSSSCSSPHDARLARAHGASHGRDVDRGRRAGGAAS